MNLYVFVIIYCINKWLILNQKPFWHRPHGIKQKERIDMDVSTVANTAGCCYLANKVLGQTINAIGQDLANLYQVGRDKIINAAKRKISNIDDGKNANLRVSRDVFWNGSFSTDPICAEYFGGVLAAARTDSGTDDRGVFYVDIIKSLSASQLYLHYIIYNCLNKLMTANAYNRHVNCALESDISQCQIHFLLKELDDLGVFIQTDFMAVYNKGLIKYYEYGKNSINNLDTVSMAGTPLGVQLFAVINNDLDNWVQFNQKTYTDFPDIKIPKSFTTDIALLQP